eukprot:1689715-Rhodomonas_salina.2
MAARQGGHMAAGFQKAQDEHRCAAMSAVIITWTLVCSRLNIACTLIRTCSIPDLNSPDPGCCAWSSLTQSYGSHPRPFTPGVIVAQPEGVAPAIAVTIAVTEAAAAAQAAAATQAASVTVSHSVSSLSTMMNALILGPGHLSKSSESLLMMSALILS